MVKEREDGLLLDCREEKEEEDGREGREREGRRKQQDGEEGRWVVGRVAVAATLLTAARDERTTRHMLRMVRMCG